MSSKKKKSGLGNCPGWFSGPIGHYYCYALLAFFMLLTFKGRSSLSQSQQKLLPKNSRFGHLSRNGSRY